MFDYLGVLISLILGLALTHLLLGLSRLIQHREQTRIYWVQLVWALNAALFVLAIWYGMSWWRLLPGWHFEGFLFLVVYSSTLFIQASLLFPHDGGCRDYGDYFFHNRRWFFGVQLLNHVLDIPETVAKGMAGLRPVPASYPIVELAFIAIAATGLISADRRVHAALAPIWLAVFLAYTLLTSLDHIGN